MKPEQLLVQFVPGDRVKRDVFKGEHFNIAVICLDSGHEITPSN